MQAYNNQETERQMNDDLKTLIGKQFDSFEDARKRVTEIYQNRNTSAQNVQIDITLNESNEIMTIYLCETSKPMPFVPHYSISLVEVAVLIGSALLLASIVGRWLGLC